MKKLTKVQIKKNEAIAKQVAKLQASVKALKSEIVKEDKPKANPNAPAEMSAYTVNKLDRVKGYDKNDKSIWKALLCTSAEAHLQDMKLGKAIKVFTQILAQKQAITPQIKQALNFKNVCKFLSNDKKYGKLEYFSKHQIVLICSRLLKTQVASVKLSAKVVKQDATTERALQSAKIVEARKTTKKAANKSLKVA